jgi:hypothetical protein
MIEQEEVWIFQASFFCLQERGFGWEITNVCQNVSYFGKFGG